MYEKNKKKKNDPIMGTHITATGTGIPVPLIEEEEQQELRETLQRSTIERRVTNVHYLEKTGPLAFEL